MYTYADLNSSPCSCGRLTVLYSEILPLHPPPHSPTKKPMRVKIPPKIKETLLRSAVGELYWRCCGSGVAWRSSVAAPSGRRETGGQLQLSPGPSLFLLSKTTVSRTTVSNLISVWHLYMYPHYRILSCVGGFWLFVSWYGNAQTPTLQLYHRNISVILTQCGKFL